MARLRGWAILVVMDGPVRLPCWLAVALFDFGMGRRGRRVDVLAA